MPKRDLADGAMPLLPGLVFYEVFVGALLVFGTNLKE